MDRYASVLQQLSYLPMKSRAILSTPSPAMTTIAVMITVPRNNQDEIFWAVVPILPPRSSWMTEANIETDNAAPHRALSSSLTADLEKTASRPMIRI